MKYNLTKHFMLVLFCQNYHVGRFGPAGCMFDTPGLEYISISPSANEAQIGPYCYDKDVH